LSNGQTAPSTPLRLTVGQAIVKYLQVQYSESDGEQQRLVPAMLGIFGHGNVGGLGQALLTYGDDLPYIQSRNEQATVHQAVGFAKARRRRATFACTASIGPGATNMVTGAATATINHLPVLLIVADSYASRAQGVVMQQLEHPTAGDLTVNDCLRPVSRFFDRINRPEQLLTALPEAMRVLTDPVETGAVTLAIPQDIMTDAYDYPARFFERRVWRIERPPASPQRIEELARLIQASERPVVIAGGGVRYSGGSDELAEFAELYGLPVTETFAGKGALQKDAWYTLGGVGTHGTPAAAEVVRRADLVISIGTRLMDVTTGSQSIFGGRDVRFASINVYGHDAHKQGALPVIADAREALRALNAHARAAAVKQPAPEYRREIKALQAVWKTQRAAALGPIKGESMSQAEVIGILNEFVKPGDTVVAAAGTPPGDLLQLWDATGGRHADLEYGTSCMGYEIPAALGVRMARPEHDAFALVGDGTYLMNPTELVTALQESLKVTVIVSDNHGFQSVHRVQKFRTGISFGNELRLRDPATNRLDGEFYDVNIARTAEGFGARAFRVDTTAGLRDALRESAADPRTCVIVARTETYRRVPDSTVWWDIAPAEVATDEATQKARATYEATRAEIQRFHG
jgi:3D-(3,5/4)-trihydroxycyclohexane-1,2-dione acylhydrolase (decyclizing)